MKISASAKARYYRCAAIVLAVVFVVCAGMFGLSLWERNQGEFPEQAFNDAVIEFNGKKYQPKSSLQTFLVLGLDKFDTEKAADGDSYNNDRQADFLMLFVIDNEARSCSAIHINRDTMAQVNVLGVAGDRIDTVTQQLALAHTYGNGKQVSCRNVAESVSGLLYGVGVDHYASFTMDAVSEYNDMLGGVELEVLDDFSKVDATLVKGERVTLNGAQALNYVRARGGMEDSSNLARMARQRQYLTALRDKTRQCDAENPDFMANSALKLSQHIVSDRSVNQLQELLKKITDYEFTGTKSLEGTAEVSEGLIEFYPDMQELQKTVVELFYEEVRGK